MIISIFLFFTSSIIFSIFSSFPFPPFVLLSLPSLFPSLPFSLSFRHLSLLKIQDAHLKGSGGLPKFGRLGGLPKFGRSGGLPKFGRSGGLPKFGRSGGLPCSEEWENSKDSIGWASKERKTKKPRFVSLGGLLKNENPKIHSFVSFRGSGKGELRFGWLLKPRFVQRRTEKTKIRFGGLLKNEKELRFELWGFLSLFPLTFPLLFLERINQRLGIEINSFALPESNCFGFLIPDDRIDYYSEMTFNIRSFQDVIM
ncbi:hypothetical protein RIR_jg21983.t3 [Rhizophagus irregularis DAOM 181602=DAOM 197198]|nr:hypothetical protein RIR_jg21983.t3 [Rhizophagus irregularis DAOM 181602=DAOM 197198]